MSAPRERGARGERLAADYLRGRGFTIVLLNFRTRMGEIDIIARGGEYLVFAEVKTRKPGGPRPAEYVGARKQARLILAAQEYLGANPTGLQPRFDVIEVIMRGGAADINHIENAFTL